MRFEVGRGFRVARLVPASRPGGHVFLAWLACCLPLPAAAQGWQPQHSGTTAELRGLSAADSLVVWAGGRGGVYARTSDGGSTWTSASIAGAEELFFIDAHAVSADTAWLLGTHFEGGLGRIYGTTDGGRTWTVQYQRAGEGVFLDGFAFWDSRRGVAFGDPVGGAFHVVITEDGGRTWHDVPGDRIPPPLPDEAGFAASGTAIVARGDGLAWFGTGVGRVARVFRSTDYGRSWSVVETPLEAGSSTGIFGLAFWSARDGVAVGGDHRQPESDLANVMRTRDGGVTWELVGAVEPPGVLYGVVAVPGAPTAMLVAVGPPGSGYSPDGGVSWIGVGDVGYNTAAFASPAAGWAAGTDGRIARWVARQSPPTPASSSRRD